MYSETKRILMALLILVGTISAANAGENKQQPEGSRNKSGFSAVAEENKATVDFKDVPVRKRIDYSDIHCFSGKGLGEWDKIDRQIIAPAGWQVCNAMYTKTESNGIQSMDITRINIKPNDAYHPPRFSGINVHLYCKHNQWNGVEGRIKIVNVGITMIPFDATNGQRLDAGCDMNLDIHE